MVGIRAELVFEDAGSCPVAEASAAGDSVTDITWTAADGDTVTEQVTTTDDGDTPAFEEVFDYGSQQVYEFDRPASEPCICEYIEAELGPLADVYAANGDLHVTLHTEAVDAMRDLVADLEERFGSVRVSYLVRSRSGDDEADLVPVDLRRLTDRQREVLERAHELGYFEYPRRANASEVAESLDIGPSTLIEHLNAAQSKLLVDLLEDE